MKGFSNLWRSGKTLWTSMHLSPPNSSIVCLRPTSLKQSTQEVVDMRSSLMRYLYCNNCEDKQKTVNELFLCVWTRWTHTAPVTRAAIGRPVCGALQSWWGWLRVPSSPALRDIVPENRHAADTVWRWGSEGFTVWGSDAGGKLKSKQTTSGITQI